jgi:hypothetical protein
MPPIPRARRWLALPLIVFGITVTCRGDQPTAPDAAVRDASPVMLPPAVTTSVTASTTLPVLVGAGDIANCDRIANAEATAALLDGIEGTVFTAGDNAYRDGSAANYTDCYAPTWGRHKARTRPAPGDRDYRTSGAAGYFGYFGAAAGDPATGNYSYDLGDWHVVVLNTKLSLTPSSAQMTWLRGNLTASGKACTAVIMHRPYYSSVTGIAADLAPLWDTLYTRGVELVLSADNVVYERFAPQDANGTADAAFGVRQFIVGTGGAAHQAFGTIRANSEARMTGVYGVLKLTLGATGYEWQFISDPRKPYTDTGTGSCHAAPGVVPPPVARPGGPYTSTNGTGQVAFDGSASSDPQGNLPLTYAWNFGDGGTGTGATPTHVYTANGTYTVSLVVTDATGDPSAPATTTAAVSGITTPPATGDLTVTATTTGSNPDPDGYQATVYDQAGTTVVAGPKAVAVNGSASFPALNAGTYTVKLTGLATNCSTGLTNDARTVTIEGGGTATAAFTVTCTATTGGLTVSATTSGSDPDPDGYTATVDAGTAGAVTQPVIGTAPATFTGLSAGTHTVTLGGIAANCTTSAPGNQLSVDVPAGGSATAAFAVTCSPIITTGSITVSTTTSGANLDPDGYTATLDAGTPGAVSHAVGTNGSTSFTNVSAGSHSIALSGLATNCTAAANPLTVSVSAGLMTPAAFSVSCIAPPSGTAPILIGAGDIAACGTAEQARANATAAVIDGYPDATVFTAGDNAYPNGRAIDYQNCYEPTWGRLKGRTWAALGNHEYDTGTADPTFDYFGDRAGPRGKGYYSYDLGDWHVIVLNDNIAFSSGSAQDTWLRNDLATSTKRCTLAIWHEPYTWSQGTTGGRSGSRKYLWQRLYAAGVELVVHGHRHFYERFAPMTPDLVRDDARGIRQFIIGTGGEDVWPPPTQTAANSEVLSPSGAIGVLKLTLRSGSYDWQFVPVAGQSFTDSGTTSCHD